MYNDNKYQHVCTSEISYLTYFNKHKISITDKQKWGKIKLDDNRIIQIIKKQNKQQNLKPCLRGNTMSKQMCKN